jgi:hypothetical protein
MLADWRGAPSHPTARVHIPTVGCVLVDGKARSHLARRAEGQLVQINLRVTDSIGRWWIGWVTVAGSISCWRPSVGGHGGFGGGEQPHTAHRYLEQHNTV